MSSSTSSGETIDSCGRFTATVWCAFPISVMCGRTPCVGSTSYFPHHRALPVRNRHTLSFPRLSAHNLFVSMTGRASHVDRVTRRRASIISPPPWPRTEGCPLSSIAYRYMAPLRTYGMCAPAAAGASSCELTLRTHSPQKQIAHWCRTNTPTSDIAHVSLPRTVG